MAASDRLDEIRAGSSDAGRQIVDAPGPINAWGRLDRKAYTARHVAYPGQIALLLCVHNQRLASPRPIQEDAHDAAVPLSDLAGSIH